jgi:hypothetical protein
MGELLFQLYKLPYPAVHISLGLGFLVTLLLISKIFLAFFPKFANKKRELLLITLGIPVLFLGVCFLILGKIDLIHEFIFYQFSGSELWGMIFFYLVIPGFEVLLVWKLRFSLYRTKYLLLATALISPLLLLVYFGTEAAFEFYPGARAFFDNPTSIAFIIFDFFMGFLYLYLTFLSYVFTFIVFPITLISLVKLPNLIPDKSQYHQREFLQFYVLLIIFFTVPAPFVSARVFNYLQRLHSAEPCATYSQIELFVGHARELCEYRTTKTECPKTENDLAAFKPDLYKKIQLCNNTRYYHDKETNTYIWELNSAVGNGKYTFDLKKSGYPFDKK